MFGKVTFLKRLFRADVTPEEIAKSFPQTDQVAAERFYSRFGENKFLTISFGDGTGDYDFTRDGFFKSANIYFHRQPFSMGSYMILGNDSDDELACVAIEQASGKVFLVYDVKATDNVATDYRIELASSFTDFLSNLEQE